MSESESESDQATQEHEPSEHELLERITELEAEVATLTTTLSQWVPFLQLLARANPHLVL